MDSNAELVEQISQPTYQLDVWMGQNSCACPATAWNFQLSTGLQIIIYRLSYVCNYELWSRI